MQGRPDLVLPTDGSEGDLRGFVTWRKISGAIRSDPGKDCSPDSRLPTPDSRLPTPVCPEVRSPVVKRTRGGSAQ
ncbi:hypothetical protein THIOKS1430017 [Thiocapsa sp. KS1]|nr:hypothetical protein [Thiocapsa sp. KS1]CRI67180.1 hypothetical protein THIOKS1430017 [Thiocapsa sp. KS1]